MAFSYILIKYLFTDTEKACSRNRKQTHAKKPCIYWKTDIQRGL